MSRRFDLPARAQRLFTAVWAAPTRPLKKAKKKKSRDGSRGSHLPQPDFEFSQNLPRIIFLFSLFVPPTSGPLPFPLLSLPRSLFPLLSAADTLFPLSTLVSALLLLSGGPPPSDSPKPAACAFAEPGTQPAVPPKGVALPRTRLWAYRLQHRSMSAPRTLASRLASSSFLVAACPRTASFRLLSPGSAAQAPLSRLLSTRPRLLVSAPRSSQRGRRFSTSPLHRHGQLRSPKPGEE